MAVTRYAISGTGVACGPGTQRPLSTTIGSSVQTQDLASAHTWNHEFASAYSVEAGTWTVTGWVTTASGGGPAARVTATVRRMNSSCTEQQVIGTAQSANLTSGATSEVTWSFTPGAVNFAAGDRLLVQFERTSGSRTTTLRFNHNAANTAETKLVHPDEASPTQNVDATGAFVKGLAVAFAGVALAVGPQQVTGTGAFAPMQPAELLQEDDGWLLQEDGGSLLQETEYRVSVLSPAFSGDGDVFYPQVVSAEGDFTAELSADFAGTGEAVSGQDATATGDFAKELDVSFSGSGEAVGPQQVTAAGVFASELQYAFSGSGEAIGPQQATGTGSFAAALEALFSGSGDAPPPQQASATGAFGAELSVSFDGTGSVSYEQVVGGTGQFSQQIQLSFGGDGLVIPPPPAPRFDAISRIVKEWQGTSSLTQQFTADSSITLSIYWESRISLIYTATSRLEVP